MQMDQKKKKRKTCISYLLPHNKCPQIQLLKAVTPYYLPQFLWVWNLEAGEASQVLVKRFTKVTVISRLLGCRNHSQGGLLTGLGSECWYKASIPGLLDFSTAWPACLEDVEASFPPKKEIQRAAQDKGHNDFLSPPLRSHTLHFCSILVSTRQPSLVA